MTWFCFSICSVRSAQANCTARALTSVTVAWDYHYSLHPTPRFSHSYSIIRCFITNHCKLPYHVMFEITVWPAGTLGNIAISQYRFQSSLSNILTHDFVKPELFPAPLVALFYPVLCYSPRKDSVTEIWKDEGLVSHFNSAFPTLWSQGIAFAAQNLFRTATCVRKSFQWNYCKTLFLTGHTWLLFFLAIYFSAAYNYHLAAHLSREYAFSYWNELCGCR